MLSGFRAQARIQIAAAFVLSIFETMVIVGQVQARPLSCEAFKDALAKAIHAGGDLVAQPYGWRADKADDSLQDFEGITGLYGSVQCYGVEMAQFGATAHMVGAGAQELADRRTRLIALGAASICAVEEGSPKACASEARSMYAEAMRELTASQRRGDPSPAGVGQRDLPRSGGSAQFDASDNNTISFTLSAR